MLATCLFLMLECLARMQELSFTEIVIVVIIIVIIVRVPVFLVFSLLVLWWLALSLQRLIPL